MKVCPPEPGWRRQLRPTASLQEFRRRQAQPRIGIVAGERPAQAAEGATGFLDLGSTTALARIPIPADLGSVVLRNTCLSPFAPAAVAP